MTTRRKNTWKLFSALMFAGFTTVLLIVGSGCQKDDCCRPRGCNHGWGQNGNNTSNTGNNGSNTTTTKTLPTTNTTTGTKTSNSTATGANN